MSEKILVPLMAKIAMEVTAGRYVVEPKDAQRSAEYIVSLVGKAYADGLELPGEAERLIVPHGEIPCWFEDILNERVWRSLCPPERSRSWQKQKRRKDEPGTVSVIHVCQAKEGEDGREATEV